MNERLATIYPDGKKAVYSYDGAGRPAGLETARGMADYNGKYSYAYDELNRLTEVSKDGNILRKYGHDAFGNRVLLYTG